MSATFTFNNPNETASCGCGESVALTPVSEESLQEFM
jgi:iron-sulfur cluster assembly protein